MSSSLVVSFSLDSAWEIIRMYFSQLYHEISLFSENPSKSIEGDSILLVFSLSNTILRIRVFEIIYENSLTDTRPEEKMASENVQPSKSKLKRMRSETSLLVANFLYFSLFFLSLSLKTRQTMPS